MSFPDYAPAPNQGERPAEYEIENRAVDPDGLVLAAMRKLAPWVDRTLVDLGCGSGYWLPGYADEAAAVIGVEPDPALVPLAAARDPRVTVLPGSAEHIPLQDATVDVVHARFAYFWPPRCEAGLAAAARLHRQGTALERAAVTDAWWAERGASRTRVLSRWEFTSRADFETVLRMEFPGGVADRWLAAHPGTTGLSYGYVLFCAVR